MNDLVSRRTLAPIARPCSGSSTPLSCRHLLRYGTITAAVLAASAPVPARAMDKFEIQVYEPEVNDPGQFALEAHINYTPGGRRVPEYPGEVPPDRVGRLTFEPALGVTRWFELGAYFQTMLEPDGRARYAGFKLRGKFVLPRQPSPWFFGINIEIGNVPHAVEADGWANEFRPIVGYYDGHWLFDINPIFGYALSGPDRFRPDLEPAGKIAYNTQLGCGLGVEYYASLGLVDRGFLPLGRQDHLVFATFDLMEPAGAVDHEEEGGEWELNLGLGRALTDATPQQWIIKAIVGYGF
jgi:hypothetical protein